MNDQSHEKNKRGHSQLQIIQDGTTIDEDPLADRVASELRSHPINEYINLSRLMPVPEQLIEETPFLDAQRQLRQSRISSHTFYSQIDQTQT